MKKMKMSQRFGQRAKRIFLNALPDHLTDNTVSEDYGIDVFTEVFKGEIHTGQIILFQVKGSKDIRVNHDQVVFPVEVRELLLHYYSTTVPVFYAIVDLAKEIVYLCNIQKYVHDNLAGDEKWKKKNSIRIKFPTSSRMIKTRTYNHVIDEGYELLRALRPGPVIASWEKLKRELEAKDPRLDYSLSIVDNQIIVTINPKPDSNFMFDVESISDSGKEKMLAMIEQGVQSEFDTDEISVSGSNLFLEQGKGKVIFTPHPVNTVDLELITIKASEKVGSLVFIDAKVFSGIKSMRVVGEHRSKVFRITFSFNLIDKTTSFNLTRQLQGWSEQDVRHLAFYDEIRSFIHSMRVADSLKCEIKSRGSDMLGANSSDVTFKKIADENISILEFIDMLRVIATKLNTTIALPKSISQTDIIAAAEIHQLLVLGHRVLPIPENSNIKISLPVAEARRLMELAENIYVNRSLFYFTEENLFPIFDKQINLGGIEKQYTNMSFVGNPKNFLASLTNSNVTDIVTLKFKSSKDSKMIVRRAVRTPPVLVHDHP